MYSFHFAVFAQSLVSVRKSEFSCCLSKICHYFRYFYIVETRKVVLAMNSLSAYHLIIRLHCSNAII